MGAALVLLLVGLAALAAGVLIGRYYVPDDRQLRRTARHSRAYMRALSSLISRDHDTVIGELRTIVEENIDDVEPYFALGAMFRSRGEYERAIRTHQALALRERDKRKLRQRAMYELGLDFRAAGMPRRATQAMEKVLLDDPGHEGGLRALAALYEEQARFNEAAELWQRLGKRRNEDTTVREHHLLVAAAQASLARDELESAKEQLKAAQRIQESAHFFAAAAELAAARGNHTGAIERLKQALVADPALAVHLLPGLIAAEQSAVNGTSAPADELAEDEAAAVTTAAIADAAAASLALLAGDPGTALAPLGVALVPAERPSSSVAERVLTLLAEIEGKTGPRLELALIRAHLAPSTDPAAQTALANELEARFPEALASRVASARIALSHGTEADVKTALAKLVADGGSLAWSLRGRWQCSNCGHRPAQFSWRCGQCRRWASLHMETGIELPPVPPRERRAAPRTPRVDGLLGAPPDDALPVATLDPGLSDEELARAGTRRSLLGRVGGWFQGAINRER